MDEFELEKVINKKKEEGSLFVERKKKNLKKAIESGMLNPEQQYGMIESTIDDLLIVNAMNEDGVRQFQNKIDEYMDQLEELQSNISSLYKKTYESILEL